MLGLGMCTSSIFNSQHVATWPNACNVCHPTMLQSVAFKCCNSLARACKRWANNVGICCVVVLLSFGLGLRLRIELFSLGASYFRVIVTCFGARHVAISMLQSSPRCINGYKLATLGQSEILNLICHLIFQVSFYSYLSL